MQGHMTTAEKIIRRKYKNNNCRITLIPIYIKYYYYKMINSFNKDIKKYK